MNKNKIPTFNASFDFRVVLKILQKTLWIAILIMIFALIGGFLYHRYTVPVFEARSIMQVKEENKTREYLGIEAGFSESDLNSVIELIKSNTFIKECLVDLPLDVSYYKRGTFISTELYRQSPFIVYVNVNNPAILDNKIDISFIKDKYRISYEIGNEDYEYILSPEDWHSIFGGEIFVHYESPKTIRVEQENDSKQKYYFVVNNPATLQLKILRNLEVRVQNESARTIRITFRDNNPRKAAEIANTIAEKFIVYDLNRKKESANNVVKYIDQQLESIYSELDQTEKDLFTFRKTNRIPPGEQSYGSTMGSVYSNKITDIENNIIDLELEIVTLEKIKKDIATNPKLNVYELMALISGANTEQFVMNLLSSLQSLYDQKQVLLFDVTNNNFKIKTLDEQIEVKKASIVDFINSAISRLQVQLNQYKNTIAEMESEMFRDTSFKEIEYTKLNRLYGINESFYYQMIRTKAEYLISQAGLVSNNIILEKATIPKQQKSPILSLIIIISIAIGLFLILVIIVIRYLLYNKIISVNDIQTYSEIPVIGGIPTHRIKSSISQLVIHNHPKSMLAEAFRNIRANLEFINPAEGSKIVTVSSTISGEGKTFVAINLGAIIAMAGYKVILCDFDLRKPRFHKSFETDNLKGISTILIGRHSYSECIHNTEIENLHFITSGPIPPNPGEIIMQDSYTELMKYLKNNYDYIIIDTPPIGIVTDAMNSYQISDFPIYITRSGVSPKAFIEHINDFVDSSKIKNLSIILNGIEGGDSRYGYGYKYGYGYRYGYNRYGYGYGYGYTEYMKTNNYYSKDDEPKPSLLRILLELLRFRKKQ
ncbi:MAG TPA: polysaccharide biosynthesis tyrosine autokinase [Bacteroidales bacterium]|nr:polysaccharide biosynthesis tyrosine autokinase [Bacteroidales bacterium]